jgi:hypothetical protein
LTAALLFILASGNVQQRVPNSTEKDVQCVAEIVSKRGIISHPRYDSNYERKGEAQTFLDICKT